MVGLYLHVPFCVSKCPYCDFYSIDRWDDDLLDRYTDALCAAIDRAARTTGERADTLYFGGGTPSLLGGRRLTRLIERAAAGFSLANAEITLEANPADDLQETLRLFAAAGGNRLSLGMQAACDDELVTLGRRHRMASLFHAVEAARAAGLHNLSLDLMLATPQQTDESVTRAVALCRQLDAQHVSAYLLKIEPNTPFAAQQDTLALPDEDTAADRYLLAAAALEQGGWAQYEISNFAQGGYESRHNLKYWNSEPYIGLGPAAHSFFRGTRYAYSRSLAAFLQGTPPAAEDAAAPIADGSAVEYAMLRLRLTAGLRADDFAARFGRPLPSAWQQAAAALPAHLVQCDAAGIRLTREGFLLSTPLTARILKGDTPT